MKEKLLKVVAFIFNISLILFMLLGAAIVVVQIVAVIIQNGSLAVNVNDALQLWSIRAAVVSAFCGFIASYLKPKKNKS